MRLFSNIKFLLFNNHTLRQTIFKNTFWLTLSEGITRVLKLLLIVYVARILGVTEYGKFTFALSFVSLLVIFSNLGLNVITVREVSKNKENLFPSIFSLKLILSLITLVLIYIGSFFVTSNPEIQLLIWLLGIYVLIDSFLVIICSFFRAKQKMEYEFFIKALQTITITFIGFVILFYFPSIKNLSVGYLLSSLSLFIIVYLFFYLKVYPLNFNVDINIWKDLLKMSWPLALIGIFSAFYANIGSIIMGYLGQITEVGYYNAAYKVINVATIPAILISQSFLPILSSVFEKSKQQFWNIWNDQAKALIFLAFPIMGAGFIFAPNIILSVYGPNYIASILIFRILIFMVGIIFFCNIFSWLLFVSNQQRKMLWASFSGFIVNILLNFALIPIYGPYGVAYSSLIAFFLMLILYILFSLELTRSHFFNLDTLRYILRACLSTFLMIVIILKLKLSLIPLVLLGMFLYIFFFIIYERVELLIKKKHV